MERISPSTPSVAQSAPAQAPAHAAAPRASRERPQVAQAHDRFVGPRAGPGVESNYSRALPPGLSRDTYSPSRPGWHDYTQDTLVAPAGMHVTADEMRDYMTRHAVPGQDPRRPVANGQESVVVDPRGGVWGGLQAMRSWFQGQQDRVRTEISNDGLTISNRTLPGHALHDGRIVRTAYQDRAGNWHIRTHGYGNNEGTFPGFLAGVNQSQGPQIFRAVDQGMAENIRRHHAN
ncbi:MAG TPA: hypothetical protein VIG99_29180 [Myxococcaceae bacterium]